jgi:hypothetical protein
LEAVERAFEIAEHEALDVLIASDFREDPFHALE